MFDGSPSFALQEDDARSRLSQTERLRMEAVNGIRKLRLQVRPGVGINQSPLESITGFTLPASPQEKVGNMPTAYWLGPNDWLLLDAAQDVDIVASALRESANGATSCATDVTDAWSIIDVSGDDAPARLAQGCSVDLHDSAFPSGSYVLTRLQRLSVIIHRLDGAGKFRILVDRSVARFLLDWLRL